MNDLLTVGLGLVCGWAVASLLSKWLGLGLVPFFPWDDPGKNGMRLAQVILAVIMSLSVMLLAGFLLTLSGASSGRGDRDLSFSALVIYIPAIETLLTQTLPATMADRWKWSRSGMFMLIVICFAGLHLWGLGLVTGLVVGGSLGAIFGSIYMIHVHRSHWHAAGWTFLTHALHNAAGWLMIQ